MDINAFWRDILAQDRGALAGYFHADAVVRWHCTNEQFSAEEFIRANCDYPGAWEGRIERADRYGDRWVTVVKVYPKDSSASFHVVSFIETVGDKIMSLDEYWADDGDAPAWRKSMGIGRSIHDGDR